MSASAPRATVEAGEYRREPLYTVDTRDLPPDVFVDAGVTDWPRLRWRDTGRPCRVERWAAERRAFEADRRRPGAVRVGERIRDPQRGVHQGAQRADLPAPMSAPVIAVAVLAAGRSARLGTPKQLLPFGTGTLVRHAATVARDAAIGPVVVVLGFEEPAVRDALAGLDVATASNPAWASGMGTSIAVAARWAGKSGAAALVLTASDQPDVAGSTLRRLRDRFVAGPRGIVACAYAGVAGIPVLFGARYFDDLLALAGDRGARSLLERNRSDAELLECPEAAFDVDQPGDASRLADPRPDAPPQH